MTAKTAREELRKARADGHCGWCQARTEPGKLTSTKHNRPCKAITDACLPRRRR